MKVTFVSLLLILIHGCAIFHDFRSEVEVEHDSFENITTIKGIEKQSYEHSERQVYHHHRTSTHYLRTFVNHDKENISHQIYNTRFYQYEWRYYERAETNIDQELGNFTVIDRTVIDCSGSCLYSETWAVSVDTDFLESNKNGFKLKNYAKSGHSHTIKVTGKQIKQQLNAVNEVVES